MRIALVDTTKKPAVYSLALLKIGAWLRSLGHDCLYYSKSLPEEADEIWLTTVFTFDIPYALGMVREAKKRSPVVKVGGVAATLLPEHFEQEEVDVHLGLLPEAEQFSPDYSLLPEPPEYSIAHTSRGCIRKCGFCMVSKLEPEFHNRAWLGDLYPGARKVLFYDNNWLAKDIDDLRADVEQIHVLIDAGRINQVDFNQGLDARLMTEELADMLQGLPIKPVRFAFDGMQEDGYYQRAVRMMAARGFRNFMTYVLYNFKDTPQDFYYRLRTSVEMTQELKVSVDNFPMRYQPILDVDSARNYVGEHWTLEKKAAFVTIRGQHSFTGQVSMGGVLG